MISRDDIEAFEDMVMSENTDKKFKDIDQDPERMLEYKERLRLSLVLEEYYKLKAKYPMMGQGDLMYMASSNITDKEEGD